MEDMKKINTSLIISLLKGVPMEERRKIIYICLVVCFLLFTIVEILPDSQLTVKAGTIDVGPAQTYTTIQEGIDAANPGDTVYVHASVYYENVIINKTINLTGENKDTTIIDGNGSSNCIFVNSVNYVNITGFTVKNGTFGVYINSSSYSNIRGNSIINQTIGGISLNHSSKNNIIDNFICDIINKSSGWNKLYGIYLNDSSENIIETNRVYNLSAERYIYGFHFTSSSNNTISTNHVYNLTTANRSAYGMYLLNCHNNTMDSNNISELNRNDDSLGIYLSSSQYNNITSNHIFNLSANRNVRSIRLAGSSNNIIKSNYLFNNTAKIKPGDIYGITVGYCSNNIIISNIIYNFTSYYNSYGINMFGASNNTISLNEIYNLNTINLNAIGIGLYLYSHNNTVTSNTIHDFDAESYAQGILIGYYSNNTQVISNIIFNLYGNDTSWGIRSYMPQYPAFNNSFIRNIINNVKIGIYFSGTLIKVIENQIYNTTGTGLEVGWETHNNTIKANYIDNVSANDTIAYGIFLANALDNIFISNYISNVSSNNMDAYGIYIQTLSTNNTFINCSISSIKTYDFYLRMDSHAKALNTTFDPYKVYFEDGISSLEVQWYLQVYVNNTNSEPVSDAIINIYNSTNDMVASGVTDLDGFLKWIAVIERIEMLSTNITQTPHNISGSKLGFTSYADPEPLMDMNKQINITLHLEYPLHHIVITPSGPETYFVNDNRTYTVIGWNDAEETDMNLTWTPVWSVDNSSIATIDIDTGFFTAIDPGSSLVNVTSSNPTGIYNTSDFSIKPWALHHITITPSNQENYYIGDNQTYTVIGWNDASETQMNLTWTPVWSIDNSSIAIIDSGTGFFTANALGSSWVNVTSSLPTGIYNTSAFNIEPWPLDHIIITPIGSQTYYMNDIQSYTAIGWNDAAETQMNYTWTPEWDINNTSIASIDSATGEFTAVALGSGTVNVTATLFSEIYNTSSFTVQPWPLLHIVINPISPERYYIRDEITYSAVGYNDAAETQQNTSWTPIWSIDDSSIASIDPVTGEFRAIILGNSAVNVTSSTGIYNTSDFAVVPWPLHHIDITPSDLEYYYIGDIQTYAAIGWNDANETQINLTWSPVWNVDDTSLASIDTATGSFTASALGSGLVNVSDSNLPGIYNTSLFTVQPLPLQNIEITPSGSNNYYIGDTRSYIAIGYNDAQKTQINDSWTSIWSIDNNTVASINESGYFTALALGNGQITVSDSSGIITIINFFVNPWALHHITINPEGPETYEIGDVVIYTAIGWNNEEETQMNATWIPVWSLDGGIQEITWEGEEARFEATKPGGGSIMCQNETTNIYASSQIEIKEKEQDGSDVFIWVLLIIVLIIVFFIVFILLLKRKKEKDQ